MPEAVAETEAVDTTVNGEITSADNSHEILPEVVSVERLEKVWTFPKEKLKRKDVTAGNRYALVPYFPKTEEEKAEFLAWVGQEQLINLAYARLRGMATNWTESASTFDSNADDAMMTGFNETEFAKIASGFSARGESIESLNDEKDELTTKIVELGGDTKMPVTEKVELFTQITSRIKEITEAIETKRRAPRKSKGGVKAEAVAA